MKPAIVIPFAIAALSFYLMSCSPSQVKMPITETGHTPTTASEQVTVTAPDANSDTDVCEGYTLYCSMGNNTVLINMDGDIVKEWPITGMPVKMLSDGSLMGSAQMRQGQQMPAANRDSGGTPRAPYQDTIQLVQIGWDGSELWSFSGWDDDETGIMMSRQHHDYQRQDNPVGYYAPGQDFLEHGNTLILAHENYTVPEISNREIEDDVIYEVDWNGKLTGFEWHAADHFDEFGFDQSAKDAIYRAPQYDSDKGFFDWLHINSMSLLGQNHWYDETGDERFNPENIIISSRSASFIAIISRASREIVWRIGPDFSSGEVWDNIGQLVGQHHAHMIPEGLPGAGNILVFDNGGQSGYGGNGNKPRYTRSYSRVIEFDPLTFEIVWQYGEESGEQYFFSMDISSVQRLPNGNTLICEGRNGCIFEVTPDKQTVWEFTAPAQGKKDNSVYRAYRIPPEWVPGNPANYTEWEMLYR